MLTKFRGFLLLLLFIPVSCFVNKLQAQASLSGTLEEFHQRGGLPNFFKKVQSGKQVTIAYIGGSITEARNGWRDLSYAWIQSRFPGTTFKQVDATIGGTGSNLGVFRMDQDVLAHHPDLVFVEFAVNDGGPAEGIHKSMEGIVRKTWKKFPKTDICFVYTIAENGIKALQGGSFQNTAVAMEQVAEHYQVPSIHMGVEVIRMLDSGKLVFTGVPEENPGKVVFTRDRTHPLSASGHPIYARVVARHFEKMAAVAADKPHQIKAPFIHDNWENAQMIPLSKLKSKKNWEALPASDTISTKFAKYMPVLYKAAAPGATFTIRFSGKVLGVYDLIGPKSGIVDVIIDGNAPIEMVRFDGWGNNYRKNAFFLKDLPDGKHEVTFQVSGKPFDKAAILAKRNIPFTNPDDYKENSWFVGSVLVVGKVLN